MNDHPITSEHIEQFAKLLTEQGAEDSYELRKQILEEIINRQVLLQVANKLRIAEKNDTKAELQFTFESILIRTLMTDYIKEHPISEEEMLSEYENIKKEQAEMEEFKLQHILCENEKLANNLLIKLKKNPKRFEKLAQKQSKDLGSSVNGGDLGWSILENYVPPFAEAVKNLKKGEIVNKPVKTEFGWHIIRLNDVRSKNFPKFDQIKTRIEEMLQKKMLDAYQTRLVKEAKIEIK